MKSFITLALAIFAFAAIFEGAYSAECGSNEHVPVCVPCSVTCAEQDRICPQICRPNSDCYCINGYLKKDGVCVPVSQC
ncbi:unnamed protein product [Callosobruchus maculatus]|uniref:TIL domain-containing protein n=1 Tax=Callosobruchus maculatus TaxID=64391 RepID=A0A653DD73_CALMS|nr:unnamed protein product [Callosobruchus maculatus]